MNMLPAAYEAINQIFTHPFRATLWKVLALTLAVLALVWIGLDRLAIHYLTDPGWFPYPWMATAISFALGLGLVFGLAFLVAPASSLVAGFFLDDLAELVKRTSIPKAAAASRCRPAGRHGSRRDSRWCRSRSTSSRCFCFCCRGQCDRLLRRQRLSARP